jgi:hypothetical protein
MTRDYRDYDEDDLRWDEYREKAREFRRMVYDADPGHRSTGPLMRYPGDGNRAERRALRARARRNHSYAQER